MIKIVWSNEGDWPLAGPPHADDCFSFSSNMYNSVKNARRREGVDAGNINRVLFGGVSYWAHVCGTSCLKLSLCELFTAATLAVDLFSWSYWWWETHVLLAGGNIYVGVPLGNCLCWSKYFAVLAPLEVNWNIFWGLGLILMEIFLLPNHLCEIFLSRRCNSSLPTGTCARHAK